MPFSIANVTRNRHLFVVASEQSRFGRQQNWNCPESQTADLCDIEIRGLREAKSGRYTVGPIVAVG